MLSYQQGEKNYIGVSGGVEPIFATHYTRRSESFGNKFFKVFHSTIQAYIDQNDLQDKVDDADSVDLVLPEFLTRTAHKIESQKRVKIQSIIKRDSLNFSIDCFAISSWLYSFQSSVQQCH